MSVPLKRPLGPAPLSGSIWPLAVFQIELDLPTVQGMADQSERIPVANAYLRALGRAVYNFTYLEWGIVWLTETIEPGFLRKVGTLTAGQIANHFANAEKQMNGADPGKKDLENLVSIFKALVDDRNRLFHGNPFTAEGGEQRLIYDGKHGQKDWTVDLMTTFSSQVAEASISAGSLLHGGRYEAYMNRASQ